MSEKEKSILTRISEKFPKLNEKDQNYILGYIECLVTLKDKNMEKKICESWQQK